jgi:DNA repair photolyase
MRWDGLTVAEDDARTLPGYRDPAVVRTFDAPEALDTRFYEVRAKSVINRVPEASQVPFRWTINPYRGCSHACVYCAAGDTPILTADGRHRPLAELSVGDRIVGTERRGRDRRYVDTEVLAHWSTIKPAYRVTLRDGTTLVTSGDHRFLTERGWRHVAGDGRGAERRAHLTTSHSLLGCGRFASQPEHDDDYRRGYVCGMVRADADAEAVERAQAFLARSRAYAQRAATGTGPAVDPVSTQSQRRWPLSPTDAWRKGFLAGTFDAHGSCDREPLRISLADPATLGWTHSCLRHFGFDVVVDRTDGAHGLKAVRIRGGLSERLRFFHLTDPAITRKRTVQGFAIDSDADLRVESVEPLGLAMRLYDITTGTGDFIANGVVSHNCFARPTHKYLDFGAGRDFEKEIVVKVNAPEVLRAELARPSWKGEHIAMGTNTDPYQWVEGRYKLMRGIWEALRDASNPCSILTKSPLLLRDLDLMKEIAERTTITANLSIPTLEEKAWRATEPHTPSPRARIEAVAELNRAGIPCGVLIAPLMPGVNDSPAQVQELVDLCEDAGAVAIGGIALHLRGEVRGIYMDWLRHKRPDLVPEYERLYRRGAYAPKEERERLMQLVRPKGPMRPRRYLGNVESGERAPRPAPEPAQGSLF